MMDIHDLTVLLLVTSGALFTTTLVFAALWLRARERTLRLTLSPRPEHETSTAELEHLVHAVDSIVVEVERISEAQRFTAQVLMERTEAESPLIKRFPGRTITPH